MSLPEKSRPSADKVIAFIEAAGQTERWRSGYVPDGSTFVNQQRWKDDLKGYGPMVDEPEAEPELPKEPRPEISLDLWNVIRNMVQGELPSQEYRTWIGPCRLIGRDGARSRLIVEVPNEHFKGVSGGYLLPAGEYLGWSVVLVTPDEEVPS